MLQNIDMIKFDRLIKENEDARAVIGQITSGHYEIMSIIVHEIRNSMALISSASQLIELKNPQIMRVKGWARLRGDIDFVCRLVGDIASMYRGESLNSSSFSMETLLKNVSLSFAITLGHERPLIEFTSEIPKSLGALKGDAVKIEEVILNLLINAKDSIKGKGKITLSAKRFEGFITICVEDTGCGISDDEKAYIFDPFITYKSNGTGLGLPFCKKIIEAHKGSIEVQSALNKGSAFTVRLPV